MVCDGWVGLRADITGQLGAYPLEMACTHVEDVKRRFSQIVPVAPFHIVDSDQQRVVHHIHLFQEFHVPPQLL